MKLFYCDTIQALPGRAIATVKGHEPMSWETLLLLLVFSLILQIVEMKGLNKSLSSLKNFISENKPRARNIYKLFQSSELRSLFFVTVIF